MEKQKALEVSEIIVEWLRNYFGHYKFKKAVIGISGGKDSTVTAALLIKALGPENVYGVSMPDNDNRFMSKEVQAVADAIGLYNLHVLPLGGMHELIRGTLTEAAPDIEPSRQAEINVMPRLRMTALYYFAQSLGEALVVNTSNRDERLVGYGTIWGDLSGDVAPISQLSVSEVIAVGEAIGVPESLTRIPPADGLTGKTDEEMLGFKYSDVEAFFNKVRDFYPQRPTIEGTFDCIISDVGKIIDSDQFSDAEKKIALKAAAGGYKWYSVSLAFPQIEEDF